MQKDIAADGLRGWASLSVLLNHLLLAFFPLGFAYLFPFLPPLAFPGAPKHAADAIISAPLLSIFWNGNFAVCVFFVLSGYVLTKVFVDTGDVLSMKLRAARRYLRLGIPIFGSVMLAYVLLKLGLNNSVEAASVSHSWWLGQNWAFSPTFGDALREGAFRAILFGQSNYVPPLWTMGIEFTGSMIVFGFRALNLNGSIGWLGALMLAGVLLAWFPDQWMLYMGFIAGSYLGHVRREGSSWMPWFAIVTAVVGGGFDFSSWFGWTRFIPLDAIALKNVMNISGAIALVYIVRRGWFSQILTCRIAQYLGRISYALYLVHFPILLTFSSWLLVWINRNSSLPYSVTCLFVSVATLAVALPTASLFHATFDNLGIKLSRKIFHKAVPKEDSLRLLNGASGGKNDHAAPSETAIQSSVGCGVVSVTSIAANCSERA
ncbi:acyltransferase [Rhodanobacter sp. C05]|uniref:acyltransferase family protein n=1 Tax=Rhodanobacter sp. C05 TaxID=1945855 RepID=UPI0009847AF0|nr:acyltransferase [Rhodanobacter sp. C05]OOG41553.1 hypothetical protein B0E51_07695 [Rhodanobacter sp. C05]